jgi:hypothetical protein
VAREEGIWRWRHGSDVDGSSSRLGKLRWTGAQLLVVVTGPALARVGRRRRGTRNRGSGRHRLLWLLMASGSRLGDWARGRAEEEARREAVAHD